MMIARVRTSLVLAAMLLLAGCGPAGPEKVDVDGTLSFNGEPVKNGAIQLIPIVSGPMQPITVRDGKFQARGDYAVLCGEYQLVFHSWELVMPKNSELEGDDPDPIPEMMQRIEKLPKKYSTEECEEKLFLKPGSGAVTLNFNLEP